ncbi:ComEC/Rec2 family competence protein [Patescibacteria group bacterium]
MKNKKIIYSGLILLFLTSLILGGIILFLSEEKSAKVVFLDVGQGDSFLMTMGNRQVVVDGGESGKVLLEKMGKYVPFWDRKIEVLVLTHADKDHIGGLFGVLKNYDVGTVIMTNYEKDSRVYGAWNGLIKRNGVEKVEAIDGVRVRFSDDVVMDIVYPFYSMDVVTGTANDNSVGMRIDVGENSFLLTGDLSSKQEKKMIGSGLDLDVDILKVGHHGSKYSSSEKFLSFTSPVEAVVSVGEGNRYGHPHEETLKRLKDENVNIVRTDQNGDIVYECRVNEECVRLTE